MKLKNILLILNEFNKLSEEQQKEALEQIRQIGESQECQQPCHQEEPGSST